MFPTGIQQHLFDSGRTDCIFMDFGFEKFTNSFDEITKTFVCQPVSPSKFLPKPNALIFHYFMTFIILLQQMPV